MLTNALPPGHRAGPGHQARWLWRTLRAAELAGHDPAQVLADAIAERDLAGARDIPAVIDARLRHRLGSVVPLPAGPWSAQVPAIADPERRIARTSTLCAICTVRVDDRDAIAVSAFWTSPALRSVSLTVPSSSPSALAIVSRYKLTVRAESPSTPTASQ